MNLYATLDRVKSELGITDTSNDSRLMFLLEAASREIDERAGRHFYSKTETRYYDGTNGRELLLDYDLLSVSSLTVDNDADGTYDDETWSASDYELIPRNTFPAYELREPEGGQFSFSRILSGYRITGVWGYGDGESATPWETNATTVEFSDDSATTGTLTASGLQAGTTILVGTEQIYVGAVSGTALSECKRGVNGTTAAAHTPAAAFSTAKYPVSLVRLCAYIASEMYNNASRAGLSGESIGDYRYTVSQPGHVNEFIDRVISPFRKLVVA